MTKSFYVNGVHCARPLQASCCWTGKRKRDPRDRALLILWPELPDPTWKTVVNGKLAGTQEYLREHLIKLQLLKSEKTSSLP
ncbi:MAG: hypothetical protein ABSH41_11460 [Syntrophobacteraceae bacterium]